ncbi:stress response translation initiation inhibitor YciH [Candidatus Woesearchaeota archaeon]|nr:stress response translation initiation inhibitor YciH [Candidatus Woesearchaeota archaeon]
MSEICPKCGLPKDLCVCETIAREEQRIKVEEEKRKFGKIITIVSGLNTSEIDVKELIKKLKSKLACGGTAKNGTLELQGKHKVKVLHELRNLGFNV